jgi:predicted HTH transcriptional regulator
VETCAAFATGNGGAVYVGVHDDGAVVGVQLCRGTLEDLANKISRNTSPKVVPAISTAKVTDKTVVVVEVAESASKPVYAFDKPLRRSGRTNQLLFGREPQRHFVQSAVRCARFKGDEAVHFLDMKVIEGSVIEQVEEAMTFVKRHISMAAEIKDLEREERWEYPLDAVREAITNAVCHRDYAETGNVQVRIFDHGLEVWNPGTLPAGLTVEDLRRTHESKPRNKLIARAFFLIRYIEQFGTGTGRMIEDCRKAGLPELQFECRAGSFRVAFQRAVSVEERLAGLKLNERQLKAVLHVLKHGRLTRPDYERIAGVARATANRDLTGLIERGVFRQVGAARKTWYELIFSEDEKIRETKLPAKLAQKPPIETQREKIVSRNVSRKTGEKSGESA